MSKLESQLAQVKQQSILLINKIAEIELQLKNPEGNLWLPKINENYFRLADTGYIQKCNNKNDGIDLELFAINAYYQTRQEAEAELNSRQVKAELEQCEGARKFKFESLGYAFCFDDLKLNKKFIFSYPRGDFQVYFDTQELIDNAELKVGAERILKAMKWIHLGDKL